MYSCRSFTIGPYHRPSHWMWIRFCCLIWFTIGSKPINCFTITSNYALWCVVICLLVCHLNCNFNVLNAHLCELVDWNFQMKVSRFVRDEANMCFMCDRKYWMAFGFFFLSKWPFCHGLVTSAMRVTHWHIYYLNSSDLDISEQNQIQMIYVCALICHWSIQRKMMMKLYWLNGESRNRKEFLLNSIIFIGAWIDVNFHDLFVAKRIQSIDRSQPVLAFVYLINYLYICIIMRFPFDCYVVLTCIYSCLLYTLYHANVL